MITKINQLFFKRMTVHNMMKMLHVRKIQRLFRKKLTIIYFEKSLLTLKLNKSFRKNLYRGLPKDGKDTNREEKSSVLHIVNQKISIDSQSDISMYGDPGFMLITDAGRHMEKVLHDFGIDCCLDVEKRADTIFSICSKKYEIVEKITCEFTKILEDATSKEALKRGSRILWRDVYMNLVREECPFTDEGYTLDEKWDMKLDIVQLGNKWFMDRFVQTEIRTKFKLIEDEYNM
jgi:hypothetical protein